MNSNKNLGLIVGFLLLLIFISGVVMYQVLQGPVLFQDDYLSITASNSNQIIISALLGLLSGTLTVVISILLLPRFKRYSPRLAYLYLAFCMINFVPLIVDNVSVLSMLAMSKEYQNSGAENSIFFQNMGSVFYEIHSWTHYSYLLISCLPVFTLYFILLYSKLIPKAISIFGIIAVVLMFIEVLLNFFDLGLGMNMLLPLGLIQLFLPFWLMIKGFRSDDHEVQVE